ncbi:MAG TPA: protein translocase subunit SecF [Pseudomonadales bacterium]
MKLPFIDFMGMRWVTTSISLTLVVLALICLGFRGLNLGLDFTGGTLVEVEFPAPVDPQAVRVLLETKGYENGVVQYFGTERDLLIRMPPQSDADQSNMGDEILATLVETYPEVSMRQSNFVGPAVGDELTEDAALAILASLIVIMLYIMFRFTKQFAAGAVVSLIHDVIITLGIFSLFRWTFDLSVLAAILAVIGYSLNDTIVVCDRIRENFRLIRRSTPTEIINQSINQTIDRTTITSMTTLFVLLALLAAGGESIRGFAAALTIGIVVGTYSSIFVAAALVLMMDIKREDLLLPDKEKLDEERP